MAAIARKLQTPSSYEVDCSEEVNEGDLIYIDSDGVAKLAQANSIDTMPAIAFVIKKYSSKCLVSNTGILNDSSNPSTIYFVSETNAGKFQESPPSNNNTVIQIVGRGLTLNQKFIEIDPTNAIVRKE